MSSTAAVVITVLCIAVGVVAVGLCLVMRAMLSAALGDDDDEMRNKDHWGI